MPSRGMARHLVLLDRGGGVDLEAFALLPVDVARDHHHAERIAHDVQNWVDVLWHIFEKKGISVGDRREGRRRAQAPDDGKERRGGNRKKAEYKAGGWEHKDARKVRPLMTERSVGRHAAS